MSRHTAADLADLIGHSADYWVRRARRQEIPHRRIGRLIWWEDEDVQQIVDDARVTPIDPLRSAVVGRRRRS